MLRTTRRVMLNGGGALATVPWLIRRMTSDFDKQEALQPGTSAWMFTTYVAHAAAYAAALRQPRHRRAGTLRMRLVFGAAAAAGTGMLVAGIGRFSGAAQISGRLAGPFVTGGVYRFSRNPQYTGYTLALAGVACACGSAPALALSAAAGAVFARWVPVEERHLARTVGLPYEHYLATTPRWLGWPRTRPCTGSSCRSGWSWGSSPLGR